MAIRLKDIAEKVADEDLEPNELKSLTRRVGSFIRKQMGFTVKTSGKHKTYVYIPLSLIEKGETKLAQFQTGETRGDINLINKINLINPSNSKTSEGKEEKYEVLGKPMEGLICELCGKAEAELVVKYQGRKMCVHRKCMEESI